MISKLDQDRRTLGLYSSTQGMGSRKGAVYGHPPRGVGKPRVFLRPKFDLNRDFEFHEFQMKKGTVFVCQHGHERKQTATHDVNYWLASVHRGWTREAPVVHWLNC